MKKTCLFAAGVLFGTAGLKMLGSKDAKKVYAHTTAAVLRAKDCVMTEVTAVREGAGIAIATGAAIAKEISDITIASEDLFELVTFSRSFGSLTLSVRRYPCATASSPSVPSTTSPTSFIRRSLPRPCPVWRRWTASRLPLRSRKAPTLRRSTRHTVPGSLSFCSKFS